MKKTIISLLIILLSLSVNAQYDINTYRDTISVTIPNDTISGIPLTRRAFYKRLNDDRENEQVSIFGTIRWYTLSGEEFPVAKRKDFCLTADNSTYVLLPNGDYIGTIYDVKDKFGSYDSVTNKWTFSNPYIITEYQFYLLASGNPISVRELILSAMQRSTTLKLKN